MYWRRPTSICAASAPARVIESVRTWNRVSGLTAISDYLLCMATPVIWRILGKDQATSGVLQPNLSPARRPPEPISIVARSIADRHDECACFDGERENALPAEGTLGIPAMPSFLVR